MNTTDEKINNLQPSGFLILSTGNGVTVTVERSGNGKTLRYVRTFENGSFEVFKKCNF